jgi:hypothetical protein
MKKILVVAALALATAAPAQAKEVMGLELCGASGCASLDRDAASGTLGEGSGPLWSDEGVVPPAKPASYYRAVVLIGDGHEVGVRLPFWYVPDQSKLTTVRDGSAQPLAWRNAHGSWKRALDRLSNGIEPYDTPTITRATVNGDPVADPQSYLRLFTLTGKPDGYPRDLGEQIILESSPRSPWTDGNDIVYSLSAKAIIRDGEMVGVSASVASAIDARTSLAPDDRGFPWLPVAVAVGLAVLVAGALVAARRASVRRAHPGTA